MYWANYLIVQYNASILHMKLARGQSRGYIHVFFYTRIGAP